MARVLKCECGSCNVCKARVRMATKRAAMTLDERRELDARKDPEKVKINDRKRYDRDRESRIEFAARWSQQNPERLREVKRAWKKRNPEKVAAQGAVAQALRAGRLMKADTCSMCGSSDRIQGHHADYSKPLDVTWLCSSCHGATHRRPRSLTA